jgi:RNA polymerase-interacting CarD/CdnL/TRCF family regulator
MNNKRNKKDLVQSIIKAIERKEYLGTTYTIYKIYLADEKASLLKNNKK